MRGTWRTLALVAAVAAAGAAGTLLAAAVAGMGASDLAHLVTLLVPAALVTVVAAVGARPLLARASMRERFVGVALVAAVAALANLWALTGAMFVSTGTPAAAAAATALALLPVSRRISAGGPTNVMPAATQASARPGFSERNP